MSFASLSANLRLNIADFSRNLAVASRQMRNFATSLNAQYGRANMSLHKHIDGLKDVTRIVHGIVIAQTFYAGTRAIREATAAVWDFNESLDYAKVTYSALFGDAKLAGDFMKVLQEHSVETIFDYQDLAESSKKLLAYGIEYKNLMFIMEGLTNLGAMSGDTAALDRIALALGQIYTRGKLSAEEMRQLANAYVPIYDIIKDGFNLTGEQMGKVGDLNLPAADVINAVVDYANAKFASVGDAAMYTITGLQNKIVDTLKVMGVEMLDTTTVVYKSFLAYVESGLASLRDVFAEGGLGGLFNRLVPDPETQKAIRQFIANVKNLFMSVMSFGVVAGQVMSNFGQVFLTAFNIVAPIVTGFANNLAFALHSILETRNGALALRIAILAAAAAFVAFKVQAVGSLVIVALTKAIYGLSRALLILATLVTRHPILAMLTGLIAALVGVSVASSSANKSIGGLFDTLSGAAGSWSSGDVLKETQQDVEDASDAADQFNNRLEDGAGAADDLADGIGGVDKAAKKAKKTSDLLSFDEVFRLKEPVDPNAGSGGAPSYDGLSELEGLMSGLGALGDALIPEIPDFTEFIDGFTDKLFGGLKDGLLGKLALAGLGAWLMSHILSSIEGTHIEGDAMKAAKLIASTLAKALMGAFVGLGFDALASLLTKKLWQTLEEEFGMYEGSAEQAKLGATIGSVIGGAIGMVVGGLPGSLIGSAIGHLAGGIVGLAWDEIGKAFNNTVTGLGAGISQALMNGLANAIRSGAWSAGTGMFASLGAAFKGAGLMSIAKGGVIGAAIGLVVDAIAATLWNGLAEKFKLGPEAVGQAKLGQTIGGIIGTVIGGIIGGPAGAIIGSAIGTLAGGIVGLFWEKITGFFSNEDTKAGAKIGASIGNTIGGPITSAFGALAGGVVGHFWEETVKIWDAAWSDISTTFGEWLGGLINSFTEWKDSMVKAEEAYWSGVRTYWGTVFADLTTSLTTWLTNTKAYWSNVYNEIYTNVSGWWTSVKSYFSTKQQEISTTLAKWFNDTKTQWTTWYNNIASSLSLWWTNLRSSFKAKQDEVNADFSEWWKKTKEGFVGWATGVKNTIQTNIEIADKKIGEFLGLKTSISDFCTNTLKSIKDWASGIWNTINDYITRAINKIQDYIEAAKEMASSVGEKIASGASNVISAVTGGRVQLGGHATGGIFDREHVARFAEGNRAEAVIPLENARAMQPFVDAVSNGIVGSLAPIVAQINGGQSNNGLPPMYIGTLVADERGLKELYKKFELIQVQENARRGLATT